MYFWDVTLATSLFQGVENQLDISLQNLCRKIHVHNKGVPGRVREQDLWLPWTTNQLPGQQFCCCNIKTEQLVSGYLHRIKGSWQQDLNNLLIKNLIPYNNKDKSAIDIGFYDLQTTLQSATS